jgi:hypothetical protein
MREPPRAACFWHPDQVRLLSADGALLELRPIGYQFGANPQAEVGADWDANWLVVHGDVRTAEGHGWSFTDPCLTTWEAREIGSWLRGVVAGLVAPATERPEEADLLCFTEPNVALSLVGRSEGRVQVRVHLSLEALPPWLGEGVRPDIFAYFVGFDLSIDALAVAAEEWDRDCERFPVR